MAASKKDYEAVASVLNRIGTRFDVHNSEPHGEMFVAVVEDLARAFSFGNPRFQSERFIDACYKNVPATEKKD